MRSQYPSQSSQRPQLLAARARQLRLSPTPSEQRLWLQLRGRRLGVAFRRQVPIGDFIADFVAPSARLVVEVDGGSHSGRERADARRDAKLRRLGYRVLRVEAELVMKQLPVALQRVREALAPVGA